MRIVALVFDVLGEVIGLLAALLVLGVGGLEYSLRLRALEQLSVVGWQPSSSLRSAWWRVSWRSGGQG